MREIQLVAPVYIIQSLKYPQFLGMQILRTAQFELYVFRGLLFELGKRSLRVRYISTGYTRRFSSII